MTIQEIMTKTPKTCRPDDTLSEAVQLMRCNECGCLAVTASDGSGQLVGMITDRDICLAAEHQGKALKDVRVGDAMTEEVCTCSQDDTFVQVQATMWAARVRRLPVVNGSKQVVGVLSLSDLAREAMRDRTPEQREITRPEICELLAVVSEPRKNGR